MLIVFTTQSSEDLVTGNAGRIQDERETWFDRIETGKDDFGKQRSSLEYSHARAMFTSLAVPSGRLELCDQPWAIGLRDESSCGNSVDIPVGMISGKFLAFLAGVREISTG